RLEASFVTTSDLRPEQPFDLALLNIVWWPDARRGAELIALAAAHVRPGGIIAVGGGKNAGMGGAERDLTALVGPCSVMIYKKGHRVLAAERPAAWTDPAREPQHSTITVHGVTLTIEHSAGVFADGNLDPATAMLLEALEVPEGAEVLDLGCGAGMIALVIKRLVPSATLTLVDSSVVAVALAERNLERNGVAGRVLASDGVAAVAGQQFDLVVSNPPFHVGRARTDVIGRRFIAEAHSVLRPGGALVLVVNRFLRYEPDIQAAFGNGRELAGNDSYKVLAAERA
ncbi:MAG: methyltransferase, partial [Herpetosiphonaceae bacterium]|nr:methyltransferase [Herpetosiphonaceae bacterium]